MNSSRRSWVLITTLVSSSCVCTPLSSYCGPGTGVPCPNEAELVAQARGVADEAWNRNGECRGPMMGSTKRGTWVSPSTPSLCDEEYFFDRTGALFARSACCEGDCEESGIGPRLKRGPRTRDFCAESRAALLLVGARVGFSDVKLIVAPDDSGFLPLSEIGQIRRAGWELPFGAYEGMLGDGGSLTFIVRASGDGGLVPQAGVKLMEWLVFPDGGGVQHAPAY